MTAPIGREVRAGVIGALLGALAFVLSGSSAQLTPGPLGADHSVVAACDSSIGVSWTDGSNGPTYSGSATVGSSTFRVAALHLVGVDAACDGQVWELTIVGTSGAPLVTRTGSLTVIAGTATLPFPSTDTATIARTFVAVHA